MPWFGVDIAGDRTTESEDVLQDAYMRADGEGVRTIRLDEAIGICEDEAHALAAS